MNDDRGMQQWQEVGQWEQEIETTHTYPPIPIRDHDWMAVRAGAEPGCLVGRGPTEQAAIDDLKEQENEQ
jgi:hypothetical protein